MSRDNSKVTIELGYTELVNLRRFFTRGLRCARENHDYYRYKIGTYGLCDLEQKLKTASEIIKLMKATSKLTPPPLTGRESQD